MGCTARVTITMDIEVSGTWGKDCSLAQIQKQATDEAHGFISTAFHKVDPCRSRAALITHNQVTEIRFNEDKPTPSSIQIEHVPVNAYYHQKTAAIFCACGQRFSADTCMQAGHLFDLHREGAAV